MRDGFGDLRSLPRFQLAKHVRHRGARLDVLGILDEGLQIVRIDPRAHGGKAWRLPGRFAERGRLMASDAIQFFNQHSPFERRFEFAGRERRGNDLGGEFSCIEHVCPGSKKEDLPEFAVWSRASIISSRCGRFKSEFNGVQKIFTRK